MPTPTLFSIPEEYRGKWIAYQLDSDIKIIDSDKDFEKLIERLKSKGIDIRYIQIDYVPDEDVAFLV